MPFTKKQPTDRTRMKMAAHTPLLASVAVVCASHATVNALEHVAQLMDAFLDPSPRFSVAQAAATGSVRLLQRVLALLHQREGVDRFLRELWLREAVQEAAKGGHLAAMQLLLEYHPGYLASNASVLAAARGDLEMIQWLHTNQPGQTAEDLPTVLTTAAKGGYLHVLRYFLGEHGYAFCPSDTLKNAIENGHVDVAEYLYDRGVRCDMRAVGNVAAKSGFFSMVQWLHKINAPLTFTSEAMTAAAGAGHLEIVRFLHENRREGCRSRAMDGAATRGRIDILEFLYGNRQEGCTDRAIIGAASNGHLDVLDWLYRHFPRLVSRTVAAPTVAAIANGHQHVLTWLQSTVGPIPMLPAYAAVEIAKTGNLDGLKTLHAMHGTEIQWSPRVVDVAASNGDVAMLQWLYEHRPEARSSTAINEAAQEGELATVQWLHAHGVNCTAFTLTSAVMSGQLPLVQWVSDHYPNNDASAAMDIAATLGHLGIVCGRTRWNAGKKQKCHSLC